MQKVVVLCSTYKLRDLLVKNFKPENNIEIDFIGFDTFEEIVEFISNTYNKNKQSLETENIKVRYILVSTREKGNRQNSTALAVAMARLGFMVNVIAKKGRTYEELIKKIYSTLAGPPIEESAIGDGSKILPSGQKFFWHKVDLDSASKTLDKILTSYTPGKKVVIAIDMGVGKTTTLSTKHESLGPILYLAPTLRLAEDFKNKVGDNASLFNGRSKFLCHKIEEVDKLGQFRRSIAANLCQRCEHGIVTQINLGSTKAIIKKEEMEKQGVDFTNAKECNYIRQMSKSKLSTVLACAEASFSGSPRHLTKYDDNDRTIVWDDCFTPFSHVYLDEEVFKQWKLRGEAILTDSSASPELLTWAGETLSLIEELDTRRASSPTGNDMLPEPIDSSPPTWYKTWEEVGQYILDYPEDAKYMDGLILESIRKSQEDFDSLDIPVRAIIDAAKALKLGTVWFHNKKMIIGVPTLSFETFISTGGIVLDATPNKLVQKLADEVHEIRVVQPSLTVEYDAAMFRGRSGFKSKEVIKNAAKYLENIIENLFKEYRKEEVAVITHKPIASMLSSEMIPLKGYWGAHQRGHNDFMNCKVLVLDGVPVAPPSDFFLNYETSRLLLLKYCNITWEKLSGSRKKQVFSLPMKNFAAGIKSLAPDSYDATEYLRSMVTAETVQAIGRLRAVRRPDIPLKVILCTSFPLSNSYGLEIDKAFGSKSDFIRVENITNFILDKAKNNKK